MNEVNEELQIKEKKIEEMTSLLIQRKMDIEAKQELINYINQLSYFYLNNNKIKDKYDIIIREIKNLNYVLNNHLYKYFTVSSPLYNHHFKTGDICYFFFGVNIIPEMSLDHMGIIISKNRDYLYVLPICSKQKKYENAYHPVENNGTDKIKDCKKTLYLMKKEEFPFLDHDSILHITDIRCISRKRAFKYVTTLDINSEFFQEIINITYKSLFPTISYRNDTKIEKINNTLVNLLNQEIIQSHVFVHIDEYFDINDYIRHVYGKLVNKDELNFNTSVEGVYTYRLIFEDDFNNKVEKQFVLNVVNEKNKGFEHSDEKELQTV